MLISTQFHLIPQFETIDYILNLNDILTDTLLVEIIQRLPCINVVRAKLVCKRWRSMIEETHFIPNFIRYHEQISLNDTRLSLPVTLVYQFIFWHRVLTEEPGSRIHTISEHPFKLDFLPCFRPSGRHPIWVTASCKDLLICCDTKMSLWSTYYICNPLTKQWVAVPQIVGHHKVADPAMGLVVSKMGVFRLVRVLELDSDPNSNLFEAEVFCSDTSNWSKFEVTCPRSFKRSWHFKPNAIAIDNKLHWLVNSEFIVVFDPFQCNESHETACRVIDLPPEINPQVSICLGSSQERLKVCQLIGEYPNGKLVIWKIENYDTKKWELEWKISLKDMKLVDNTMYWHGFGSTSVEILGLHPSDSRIVYLRIRNHIVICNLGDRTLEVVSECSKDSTFSIGTCGVFLLMHPSWPSSIPSHA
ncbi:putative F-box protein At3g23950 [Silene latifolia]|uniref:putative F-box protein At3g23950 n=1 Tax=Silene latifolia TaxID=37657 RepID=UPI003D778E59